MPSPRYAPGRGPQHEEAHEPGEWVKYPPCGAIWTARSLGRVDRRPLHRVLLIGARTSPGSPFIARERRRHHQVPTRRRRRCAFCAGPRPGRARALAYLVALIASRRRHERLIATTSSLTSHVPRSTTTHQGPRRRPEPPAPARRRRSSTRPRKWLGAPTDARSESTRFRRYDTPRVTLTASPPCRVSTLS